MTARIPRLRLRLRRAVTRRPAEARPVRIAKWCGLGLASVVVLFVVLIAGLYLKLASSPIDLGSHSAKVENSLAARLGLDWRVSVQDTTIELLGLKPAIRMRGLEIRNPAGVLAVRAPLAVVSLNPASLLIGRFSPREIELRDLHVRGKIAPDGSLTFATQVETPATASPEPAAPAEGAGVQTPPVGDTKAPSVVSAAAESLLRPLVSPSGIIGALDRAKVVDARLTLVGADGRERVAFDGVDALFEKAEHSDRHFEIELRGQRGSWRVAGRVSGAKGHATSIQAESIPISDLMLLGGLSKVPATSDIKVSGTLAAVFLRDRLASLQGRLWGSAGSLERPGASPIRVDGASADISWDEPNHSLAIKSLRASSEGTQVDLQGKVSHEKDAWRFALGGSDVVVADQDPGRPPFRLAMLDIGGAIEDGGLRLDRLAARGDEVDVTASGTFMPGSDQVFAARLEASNTDARKLVRLWPDFINPELRAYLAQRLVSGTVQTLRLRAGFNAEDFKAAFTDDPLTDDSVETKFTASDVTLEVVDGLPPLSKLAIEGRTTGRTVSLAASSGAIATPDGRRLAFVDASFVHPSLDKKGSPAQIGFRIRGGVDAFASLLQSPLLREAGIPAFDPSSVRGNVDVKATLPFVPGPIPPLDKLGIEFGGTLSDVFAEKLPGRERLEGGQFTVAQDAGGFGIKGEAKLSGSPATFELRVPKAGGGELTVNTVLDDAARTRRSLPSAPSLTGPVGVKVSLPLKGAKMAPRIEADLSKAAVEGLLPGWQKSAGKPGRVQFTLNDGATTELHDLAVDAGSVQIKGAASLAAAGGLERADLSSFRMSSGDDMRVQVERSGSGYRITMRGNNADARPLLKWLNAPPAKGGSREGHDIDLDLNVAILSGFNDEAMTGVVAKASTRGGELRSLQFGGKFRSAAVEATLAKRDGGAPALSFRSWDAGATLRFLDFYRRMNGGRLGLEARMGEGVQEGQVTIEDFGLRGEPALRRIVTQTQQQAGNGSDEGRGLAPISQQDIDQVLFNRLTTGFRRTGSRTDYVDAVIYGPQVGFNLSGWVDSARDRLDIAGTFVPAFALNNAFSQLPVIGLILGGGRTEGLIAVEFRVAGALSGPNVTVNPLTAVAPGILRKLFGWMTPEGQAAPAAASADNRATPATRRRLR